LQPEAISCYQKMQGQAKSETHYGKKDQVRKHVMKLKQMRKACYSAEEKIIQRLINYGKHRGLDKLAGQFLDDAGCRDPHNGLTGVAIWTIIAQEIPEDCDNSQQIRYNCTKVLKRLASGTSCDQLSNITDGVDYNEKKFDNDAKNVTVKTVHLVDALVRIDINESNFHNLLLKMDKERTRYKWGFLIGDQCKNDPIATAFVILRLSRCKKIDLLPAEDLAQALSYIESEIGRQKSAVARLYLLNCLMRLSDTSKTHFFKREIRREIRKIFKEVNDNPCIVQNPWIVDYQDRKAERARYLRIPSDITILEALMWLDIDNLRYLRSNSGKKMLWHFFDTIISGNQNLDSSGARWSCYSALYTTEFVKDLKKYCRKERLSLKAKINKAIKEERKKLIKKCAHPEALFLY